MNSTSYDEYLAPCCAIAREAGRVIMTYFTGEFSTRSKDDNSPVTDADIAANTLIVNALVKAFPSIPVVAEEDKEIIKGKHELFWLVDPLDGTLSFVRGEPEFTVNIGLIHHHRPVLGVIYVPPLHTLYFAQAGKGAFRSVMDAAPQPIEARRPAEDGLVVVRSRSKPSPLAAGFLDKLRIKTTIPGSSSAKFCHIAEGGADMYPRFGRTMEWDTAAGHAILEAAGGRVETVDGQPLTYGKPGFENPHFIAYGK
jgi:3'(2'), 5'-bisphosphate nucleotidase